MVKFVVNYCTDYDPATLLSAKPEHQYESYIRTLVSENLQAISDTVVKFTTYSSVAVQVFKLLVCEGVLVPEQVELILGGQLMQLNEYGVIVGGDDPLSVSNLLSEKLLLTAIKKRKARSVKAAQLAML